MSNDRSELARQRETDDRMIQRLRDEAATWPEGAWVQYVRILLRRIESLERTRENYFRSH